jgi:hypothetical protein
VPRLRIAGGGAAEENRWRIVAEIAKDLDARGFGTLLRCSLKMAASGTAVWTDGGTGMNHLDVVYPSVRKGVAGRLGVRSRL